MTHSSDSRERRCFVLKIPRGDTHGVGEKEVSHGHCGPPRNFTVAHPVTSGLLQLHFLLLLKRAVTRDSFMGKSHNNLAFCGTPDTNKRYGCRRMYSHIVVGLDQERISSLRYLSSCKRSPHLPKNLLLWERLEESMART